MFLRKMFMHARVAAFQSSVRLVSGGAEKSSLAALRKKTGYTFANCKKALEMHNNDLALAEKWLHEQAQTLGWAKATKLADRVTTQGLVGVVVNKNIGAMVEVNCETDFVARNEHFRSFVDIAAKVCAEYTKLTLFDGDLWKMGFEAEALRQLKAPDKKSLSDHLALLIGLVGENASISRAICFKASNDVILAGYAHPAASDVTPGSTQFGRYGAIVAFQCAHNLFGDELRRNLCQHIVGMNPRKVGDPDKDQPLACKDDEPCLIHQAFLADEERTVDEVLREHSVRVLDFQRFECGVVQQSNAEQLEKARAQSD